MKNAVMKRHLRTQARCSVAHLAVEKEPDLLQGHAVYAPRSRELHRLWRQAANVEERVVTAHGAHLQAPGEVLLCIVEIEDCSQALLQPRVCCFTAQVLCSVDVSVFLIVSRDCRLLQLQCIHAALGELKASACKLHTARMLLRAGT